MLNVRRVELKFFIRDTDVPELLDILTHTMYVDPNCINDKPYHLSSIYFDDQDDSALLDKLNGVPYRKKYRLRIYDKNVEHGKFEVKIKNENTIEKKSLTLNNSAMNAILKGNYEDLLKEEELSSNITDLIMDSYTPKAVVHYDRFAFALPFNSLRVTLDLNLSASGYSGLRDVSCAINSSNMIGLDGVQILEVKYIDYLPQFLGDILSKFSLARTAISKYAAARILTDESLNGDRPYFPM